MINSGYVNGVTALGFSGSCTQPAFDTTTTNPATGFASLELTIPANCGGGGYSGFTLLPTAPVDLHAYNALTFYAKASAPVTLGTAGIGNDGTSPVQTYSAEVDNSLALTTAWAQYTIPLPAPAQATAMTGLFHIAQGSTSTAVSIWLNDIQYVTISPPPTNVGNTYPFAATTVAPGATAALPATGTVTFSAPAATETAVGAGWYTFSSSAPNIATVAGSVITASTTSGTTTLTATLDGNAVSGSEVVTVAVPQVPTSSPPVPTATADLALYSPTYNATAVWSYDAGFCGKDSFAPYQITGGDKVLQYTLSSTATCFAWADAAVGGSVGSNQNVSAFTHVHVDIWTATAPPVIDIRLVDFTGAAATADFFVSYGSGVAAACAALQWCGIDIPLSSGSTVPQYKALGQMLLIAQSAAGKNITGGSYTLYIDNFYFH